MKDPRFSALYTSHHYNLDPSDPNFKKTSGMEAIVQEKMKRRNAEPSPAEVMHLIFKNFKTIPD